MNNTIQSTNFGGAFRVNYKHAQSLKSQLETLVDKKNAQIYNCFGKEYETLYVVPDCYDDKIADFIFDNKELSFYYYPEINKALSSKINNLKDVLGFLKHRMTRKIRDRQEMLSVVGDMLQKNINKTVNHKSNQINVQPKYDSLITAILNNLCIDNLHGTPVVTENGVTKIYQKYKIGQFRMSPPNKEGYRCVYAKADDVKAPEYRCLIDKDGNIVNYYISTAEKNEFKNLFNTFVSNFRK